MAVERSRWTDDRLDQLAERVMRQDAFEARFDGLDRRLDSLGALRPDLAPALTAHHSATRNG
jgi:hypothetical protein